VSSEQISDYYNVTADRDARAELKFALDQFDGPGIAVDCGCGAGADIAYLRQQGFSVHAFDVEAESIHRCQQRFADDSQVFLSQASFETFDYPEADLVTADASLFFCPPQAIDDVIDKIHTALVPGGIFNGAFLGPEDTMAGPDYDPEAYWSSVLTLTEKELRQKLQRFEILKWQEIKRQGKTAQGDDHFWHIYSVVAQKQ